MREQSPTNAIRGSLDVNILQKKTEPDIKRKGTPKDIITAFMPIFKVVKTNTSSPIW